LASAPSPTLRRGLRVVGQGIRQQPRWFALAVLGSAVYGVMTVATATVIGKVVREIVSPAITARQVNPGQLWLAGLMLSAVVLVNVAGIVVRRIAAGITFNNLCAVAC
jgi:ATP-binding cassette subfamily B protein